MASPWTSSGDFVTRENKIKMCSKRQDGERSCRVVVEAFAVRAHSLYFPLQWCPEFLFPEFALFCPLILSFQWCPIAPSIPEVGPVSLLQEVCPVWELLDAPPECTIRLSMVIFASIRDETAADELIHPLSRWGSHQHCDGRLVKRKEAGREHSTRAMDQVSPESCPITTVFIT